MYTTVGLLDEADVAATPLPAQNQAMVLAWEHIFTIRHKA
jgi:hypothetical protein